MRFSILLVMATSLLSHFVSANTLQIGASAPAVQSIDHDGNPIDLEKALSNGTTLVFFYPKAMTPGCTKQACSLRDGWDMLKEKNITIYGVSSDTPAAQTKFKEKHQLPFTLIADTDKKVAKAFGKNRWSRQAYLFNDGVLVWRDLSASTSNQFEDVIEALEQL